MADDEWQLLVFTNFLQTAARNDSNDTSLERYRRGATFSCRTLSLILYGLRAVLNLPKCGHSVFRDTQIDVGTSSDWKPHCIGRKTALHQTGKRTVWFSFFVGRKFLKTTKKTALLLDWKPHCIRRSSELHGFFSQTTFFPKQALKSTCALHQTEEHTASD